MLVLSVLAALPAGIRDLELAGPCAGPCRRCCSASAAWRRCTSPAAVQTCSGAMLLHLLCYASCAACAWTTGSHQWDGPGTSGKMQRCCACLPARQQRWRQPPRLTSLELRVRWDENAAALCRSLPALQELRWALCVELQLLSFCLQPLCR